MEPVLFYGVPQGCSFGSIVALEWLNLPYRLCRIEMLEHPWPALYARVNPLNLTPAYLTEDGVALRESSTILLHLAAQGDMKLGYAQGTREYDRLNQTLLYLNTDFFAAFGHLWIAYEMKSEPHKQEVLRELGRQRVAAACDHLNTLLAEREWIDGGAKRTVADAYFVGLARWGEYHRVLDAKKYPHFYRHLQKLRDDPAVVFADAIEKKKATVSSGKLLGHVTLEELEPVLPA